MPPPPDPQQKRRRLHAILRVLQQLVHAGFFFQDETRLDLNPRVGVDNDGSHTSGQVHQYLEESEGRIELHPLPARSPQDNPVELIWWGLHEAITRNQGCKDLEELLAWAERYLKEKQPFALHLGKDYPKLGRSPPKRVRVHLS